MRSKLQFLRNFWVYSPLVCLAALLACWFFLPAWGMTRDEIVAAMILIGAFYLAVIGVINFKRVRAEKNIEGLLHREVDRSQNSANAFGDKQVLRDGLKHAIGLLRTSRSAGGGGATALYDLPWYLVIGMSSAGKTSLLTRSGLSASVASGRSSGLDSGTQHCDWYFSPDAVLIDTAGRYLHDDQSASEFADFLKLLKKQRSKPAVNGLVLVVSLPEIISATAAQRQELAERLISRIGEYTDCLGINPPIYLMLSKTDQLPGFDAAFAGMDLNQRQQPLGMTFALPEVRQLGLQKVLEQKFGRLVSRVREHVDGQTVALGVDADVDLLQFPSYFAGLSSVLTQFLSRFEVLAQGRTPPILRGVYFTSALQTGQRLPTLYTDFLSAKYVLETGKAPKEKTDEKQPGDKSYFITETFRRIIFPDRNLSLYYSRLGRTKALNPALIAIAVAMGVGFLIWNAVAFQKNRVWLTSIGQDMTGLEQAPARDERLRSGEALEMLRQHLVQVETQQQQGVLQKLSSGLYSANAAHAFLQRAYLQQLKTEALEPIGKQLQVQLRGLNDLAQHLAANTPSPVKKGSTGKSSKRQAQVDDQVSKGVRVFKASIGDPLTLGNVPNGVPAVVNRLKGSANNAGQQIRNSALNALRGDLKGSTNSDANQNLESMTGISLSEDVLGRLDEQQITTVIAAYDALKLYLILTQPDTHPEADFVADELPGAWARTAAAEGVDISSKVIADNASMYVRSLQNKQAPALRRNEALVAEARQKLKSFMIASSLVDREYLQLQLESARQFPALTLVDLVPMPGRSQLFSAVAVPAIYSRQGWNDFLKPELVKLLSGPLRQDADWVLDGEGGEAIVQKANFMRDLMARYKADYAKAWYRLLDGTGVRQFTDIENASQQLMQLSDVQNSPVKSLLAAVHHNTSWDLPDRAEISVQGDTEKSTPNTLGFDGTQIAAFVLPKIDDGSLARSFEPVSRLFAAENPEGVDSTIMDRYLGALRKLKVRLTNIQRSQDVGKNSKLLIGETLEGQPSEVTTLRNYVETNIDTSKGGLSTSLQRLFNAPIQFTWESLRDPAGHQIANAWSQQIARPWQQVMAHRYPIAPASRNEASVKDLQRFVHPESGLLPAFKRNEIGNLADGEGLGLSGDSNAAPLVNPKMINGIAKASLLGEVIASLSDRENGFEIMLEPSAHYTDIVFTLDGQVLHYRNGKSSWNRFVWPGTTSAPGARLDVVTLSGERVTVFDYPGRWGLLKMNDSARVANLDEVQQRFTWPSASGQVSLVVRNYGGVKMTDLAGVKSLNSLNDLGRME
ncbi:MAG: ImcF-like family protein [Pseudomonas sp.]|nr:ImcF-like family protein [Pseudomonas sp.]